jgi:endonuclease/exonuclease/phosphatase (EEP) superfamily protein YafD
MSLIQGNRRRGRDVSRLQRGLRTLLGASFILLLALSAAPLLRHYSPPLSLFEHFAVQLGAGALICAALMLLTGMRLWALLAVAVALWHGATIYPFLPKPWVSAPVAADVPPLKVLSLNLWYLSESRAETVKYLLDSGADVIGTVETTEEWRDDLKPLEAVYPYHVDCVGVVFRCGVGLYSKLPILDSGGTRIEGKLPIVAWAKLDWQGKPLTFAELQVMNPLNGLLQDYQQEQAERMKRFFAGLAGDLVVMGDFNSTPWSALQRGLRDASGLDNTGRLALTWPSWAPAALRLPIDQIFTRGAITARDVGPGPMAGSDHLPIRGEIVRLVP